MCINCVCTFIEFRNNEQKFFHTIRRLTHCGHRTQYRQQNFNAFWRQILGFRSKFFSGEAGGILQPLLPHIILLPRVGTGDERLSPLTSDSDSISARRVDNWPGH